MRESPNSLVKKTRQLVGANRIETPQKSDVLFPAQMSEQVGSTAELNGQPQYDKLFSQILGSRLNSITAGGEMQIQRDGRITMKNGEILEQVLHSGMSISRSLASQLGIYRQLLDAKRTAPTDLKNNTNAPRKTSDELSTALQKEKTRCKGYLSVARLSAKRIVEEYTPAECKKFPKQLAESITQQLESQGGVPSPETISQAVAECIQRVGAGEVLAKEELDFFVKLANTASADQAISTERVRNAVSGRDEGLKTQLISALTTIIEKDVSKMRESYQQAQQTEIPFQTDAAGELLIQDMSHLTGGSRVGMQLGLIAAFNMFTLTASAGVGGAFIKGVVFPLSSIRNIKQERASLETLKDMAAKAKLTVEEVTQLISQYEANTLKVIGESSNQPMREKYFNKVSNMAGNLFGFHGKIGDKLTVHDSAGAQEVFLEIIENARLNQLQLENPAEFAAHQKQGIDHYSQKPITDGNQAMETTKSVVEGRISKISNLPKALFKKCMTKIEHDEQSRFTSFEKSGEKRLKMTTILQDQLKNGVIDESLYQSELKRLSQEAVSGFTSNREQFVEGGYSLKEGFRDIWDVRTQLDSVLSTSGYFLGLMTCDVVEHHFLEHLESITEHIKHIASPLGGILEKHELTYELVKILETAGEKVVEMASIELFFEQLAGMVWGTQDKLLATAKTQAEKITLIQHLTTDAKAKLGRDTSTLGRLTGLKNRLLQPVTVSNK
jgi:hypothetical protein